jgi:hypothetical protein
MSNRVLFEQTRTARAAEEFHARACLIRPGMADECWTRRGVCLGPSGKAQGKEVPVLRPVFNLLQPSFLLLSCLLLSCAFKFATFHRFLS